MQVRCNMRPTVEERFWAKVNKTEDCWLWTGGLDKKGYANLNVEGRSTKAHRWSWEQVNGPIPDGLHIDHLCRVRHCVRPDHLEPVTLAENNRRQADALYPTCKRGHPWTPENTGTVTRGGWKTCRKCNAERMQRRRDLERAGREYTPLP